MADLSKTPVNANRYHIPSVNRAMDILLFVHKHGPSTLAEIKSGLGIPHSTCFNLVATLMSKDFLQVEGGRFDLGWNLLPLGMAVRNKNDLRSVAYPTMQDLVQKYNETCYLSIVDKTTFEAIVIERVDGANALAVLTQVGERVPLYATGTGKALLAALSDGELAQFFATVPRIPYTSYTRIEEEDIRTDIMESRQKGYAVSISDKDEGVCSVSAPIRDGSQVTVAAISIAAPETRVAQKISLLGHAVKEAAESISHRLGYERS